MIFAKFVVCTFCAYTVVYYIKKKKVTKYMRTIAKSIVLSLVAFLFCLSVEGRAQRVIERYVTINAGQTGYVDERIDTLFYEDFESGNASCWTVRPTLNGSGFSVGTQLCLRGDCNTVAATPIGGSYAAWEYDYDYVNFSNMDDDTKLQYIGGFTTPNIPVFRPTSTTVSFVAWNGEYTDEYGLLTIDDEVGLLVYYEGGSGRRVWNDNCITCARQWYAPGIWEPMSYTLESSDVAGNMQFMFSHVNEGGIGMGFDNVLINGPRRTLIPAEVSALPGGTNDYTTDEYVYRVGCQQQIIRTHWTILDNTPTGSNVQYFDICEGQTGYFTFMDTLLYADFNDGIDCWGATHASGSSVNDFYVGDRIRLWADPSQYMTAYQGYSAFVQGTDASYSSTYSRASFLSSPTVNIYDPSQTKLSFYYYNEVFTIESCDYYGYYYDCLYENYINEFAVVGNVNGTPVYIWDLGQVDIDSWRRKDVTLSMLSSGDNQIQFASNNYGGVGSGVDNVLVYGPRAVAIPAEVSSAAAGSVITTATMYENRVGCGSTPVTIVWTVHPAPKDTVVVMQPNSYTWALPEGNGVTYTESGMYSKNAGQTQYGCDSTVYLDLTLSFDRRVVVPVGSCDPYTWEATGQTYTESGRDSVQCTACNIYGGDSTTVLDYTRYPSYTDISDYMEDCEHLAFDGFTFTSDTVFSRTLTTVRSCDSVVTYTVHIKHTSSSTTTLTIPDSYTWALPEGNGQTYTESGIYSKSAGLNAEGCDSTAYLNLTISHDRRVEVPVTACGSYQWSETGATYTESGMDSVQCTACNIYGGDSTTVLVLTILPVYTDIRVDSIGCDTLLFNGVAYVVDAEAPVMLQTVVGACDSLVTYSLHIMPSYHVNDTMDACYEEGMTIPWRHTILPSGTTSGVYYLDTVSRYGCDSTFTLDLTLRGSTYVELGDTIVENDLPYAYDAWTFYNAVTDSVFQLTDIYGCDSLVAFTLMVYPNVEADAYATVCYSQLPYTWNGVTFYATSLGGEPSGDIMQQTTLLTTHGADSLRTMHLHVNPIYGLTFYDTVCDNMPFTFGDSTYTYTQGTDRTVRYSDTLATVNLCDSVVDMLLTVRPTYSTTSYDTAYSNLLPYRWFNLACESANTYQHREATVSGCDSMFYLHLAISPVTFLDTAVCSNRMPVTWHGIDFDVARTDTAFLATESGVDSLLLLNLRVLDTAATTDRREACDTLRWINGIVYSNDTDEPFVVRRAANGCDSVVHLSLAIHPSYSTEDSITACNTYTWVDGITYNESTAGEQYMLRSAYDCDSLVTLALHIGHSSYDEQMDSMCLGSSYRFRNRTLYGSGTYFDTLRTVDGCDSVTVLHLAALPTPLLEVAQSEDCDSNIYHITLTTDVNYVHWTAFPYDSRLDGHDTMRSVSLSPKSETTYTIYADYDSVPTCPATAVLSLAPLKRPVARMHVTPDYLSYDNNMIVATDVGYVYDSRHWYINGFMQETTSNTISQPISLDNDSAVVMLEVTEGFCKDSVKQVIYVHTPTLFVPNMFTPFLSYNKIFKAEGNGILEFHMFIYDRHGLLVFSSNDIEEGWDGKHDGTVCQQGSYVYLIRYRDTAKPNSYQEMTGSVLLVR